MDDICDSVRVFGYPKPMDAKRDLKQIWQPVMEANHVSREICSSNKETQS